LGYVLNRAYWSQGFATEATLRLARFGFEELDLHRIEATCHPDNGASPEFSRRPASSSRDACVTTCRRAGSGAIPCCTRRSALPDGAPLPS